jgi:hypothetical protein
VVIAIATAAATRRARMVRGRSTAARRTIDAGPSTIDCSSPDVVLCGDFEAGLDAMDRRRLGDARDRRRVHARRRGLAARRGRHDTRREPASALAIGRRAPCVFAGVTLA